MDCETYRTRLLEDPSANVAELGAHEASCAPCRAYAARVRAAEERIAQALRFDVAAYRERYADALAREQAAAGSVVTSRAGGRWLYAIGGAAAGVIATLAIVLYTLTPQNDPQTLAAAVVEHWYDEPGSWVRTTSTVSEDAITAVLDGQAEMDLGAVGRPVSYVKSCLVDGQWVPHLVVQGRSGPFMVLLMPERPLQSPVPLTLEQEALNGSLLPAGPGGSIAVLGPSVDESEEVGRAIAAAVEWTI